VLVNANHFCKQGWIVSGVSGSAGDCGEIFRKALAAESRRVLSLATCSLPSSPVGSTLDLRPEVRDFLAGGVACWSYDEPRALSLIRQAMRELDAN
jgi:hypothetical protein